MNYLVAMASDNFPLSFRVWRKTENWSKIQDAGGTSLYWLSFIQVRQPTEWMMVMVTLKPRRWVLEVLRQKKTWPAVTEPPFYINEGKVISLLQQTWLILPSNSEYSLTELLLVFGWGWEANWKNNGLSQMEKLWSKRKNLTIFL